MTIAIPEPTPLPSTGATPTPPRSWPFLIGFEGRPWAESVDLFQLLLDYGDEAVLYVAAMMSIFGDARAPADAALPLPDNDRRGWWADTYALQTLFADDARPMGSLLWLLSRSKNESGNPAKVEAYIQDSLKWMITAGLATETETIAAYAHTGVIAVAVKITNNVGTGIILAHPDFWEVFGVYHD